MAMNNQGEEESVTSPQSPSEAESAEMRELEREVRAFIHPPGHPPPTSAAPLSRGNESAGDPAVRLREIIKQASIVQEQLESFTLNVDSLDLIGELMQEGLTPSQAVDFVAIEEVGKGQTEWANETGRSRQGVHGNYTKAKEKLEDD